MFRVFSSSRPPSSSVATPSSCGGGSVGRVGRRHGWEHAAVTDKHSAARDSSSADRADLCLYSVIDRLLPFPDVIQESQRLFACRHLARQFGLVGFQGGDALRIVPEKPPRTGHCQRQADKLSDDATVLPDKCQAHSVASLSGTFI